MDLGSTILAVSSPPGHSARGIIRVSGPSARTLVNRRLESPCPDDRGVHGVRFRLDDIAVPALALLTTGNQSYSGEDTIELQVPGHPALLGAMVNSMLNDGLIAGLNVRLAGPGEFTARAFLSGKMDLVEAESVAAVISARSDDEIKAAGLMRDGRLGDLVEQVSERIAAALALVEAGIDFTEEEDVVAIGSAALAEQLDESAAPLKHYLDRSIGLESLQSLPWVVLEGPPNAGKSTLFNAMLGKSRALVSSVRGTTRDVLAEPLRLGEQDEAEILLVDVAGDEKARTPMDEAMQRAANEARDRAEVRLFCAPLTEQFDSVEDVPEMIRVATKADLAGTESDWADVVVCAMDGTGLDQLRVLIRARLAEAGSSLAGDAMVLAPRQEVAMKLALDRLEEAKQRLSFSKEAIDDPELVAGLMRDALDQLGEITGVISPDEILDRVFSSFCIGK
ncbi:MAG: 50S ribosome-binding GTPase [Phycisphaerales bacterium]|nr:50S ribosome-binding GTPase [Phycisphaerales bacterium]